MRIKPVAAFAALALGLASGAALAQEKVRFAYAVQIHQANMMIIQDYAKKNGIELEITPLRRYADLQLALTTNQVDAAALGYVNIGLMEEKDFKDFKVVAGVFTGGQSLTLRNGVTAKSWKDLEGKTLGTAPNSYAELLFKATAKLAGADLGKIKTVSFAGGGPPLTAAMKAGEIDGFVFWEPNNADAVVNKVGYYSDLDIGANPSKHINGMLAVNAKFAAAKPKAVEGLVKALVEATDALNADGKRYFDVAQKGTGATAEIVKESIPRGKLDYRLYQPEAKYLLKMISEAGITKIDTSPAVDRTFDYSYLMKATGKSKKELGGE
jgi:ABC-type nitrate/sulfonate/bicarbonate transport system substrate-binding protein